jgi:hypothetical protein
MSSELPNDRKRKPPVEPEAVVGSSQRQNQTPKENKARRVSTDASASYVDSTQMTTLVKSVTGVTSVNAASVSDAEQEEAMLSIGEWIQDLIHSDNAKVDAALYALFLNLNNDSKKSYHILTVGGCHALVQLVRDCLQKVTTLIPACDQATEFKTLRKSLHVIIKLTYTHAISRVGITAAGGVEAVVEVMKKFPKCEVLQFYACGVLRHLTLCNIGKKKVVETGGIEVLLAALHNHLGSFIVCEHACLTLVRITTCSKENTELLITLGGASAVAKVKKNGPDNEQVQTYVRKLANFMAAELKTWGDEE